MDIKKLFDRIFFNLRSPQLRGRWYSLTEVFGRGYSWNYRWYRFKEAFSFPSLEELEEDRRKFAMTFCNDQKVRAKLYRPGDKVLVRFDWEDTFTPSVFENAEVCSMPIEKDGVIYVDAMLGDIYMPRVRFDRIY